MDCILSLINLIFTLIVSFLLAVVICTPQDLSTNLSPFMRSNLNVLDKKYIDSSKLLPINGSAIVEKGSYLWDYSYAPYTVLCPSSSLIRPANNELGQDEASYLENRKKLIEIALHDLLSRNKIPNFNHTEFLINKSKSINIALAISGGGYRSMLIGGGILEAYDIRTPNSSGNLGGLLQSLSYIGGISGGSWLVMSNFINDFRPIHLLKDDSKSWCLSHQLLEGIPSFDPLLFQEHIIIDKSTKDKDQIFGSSNKNHTLGEEDEGFFGSILRFFNFGKSASTQESNDLKSNSKKVIKEIDTKSEILKISTKEGDIRDGVFRSSLITNLVKQMFLKEKSLNSANVTKLPAKLNEDVSWKNVFRYYKELHIEVRAKRAAGFYISFTDYWGRALARRIFTTTARTPGATITASTKLPSFQKHEQPFPIICAVEKLPSYTESSKSSHLFEFTPYEFGSWDSYLNAFIPLKYLGSSLHDGHSIYPTEYPNVSMCISGFDNVGFITGTSSSLFNHVFLYLYQLLLDIKSDASLALEKILKSFGLSSSFKSLKHPQLHPDYALYSPNPFYGYKNSKSNITNSLHMYLVDGGDDGQNIPFHPFLRKARQVDIVLAFDMTADYLNYPNGTTLKSTHERYHNNQSDIDLPYFVWNRTIEPTNPFTGRNYNQSSSQPARIQFKSSFPHVPTPDEIVKFNLNKRPVFFGCDLETDYPELKLMDEQKTNATGTNNPTKLLENSYLPPLIIYSANYNYSFPANKSTFQLSYTKEEVFGMIGNGYNLATFMNSTFYSVCLNCAILKREFDRIELGMNANYHPNFTIPSTCRRCFKEFCWSGSHGAFSDW